MSRVLCAFLMLGLNLTAYAEPVVDLSRFPGYAVILKATIVGWYDDKGNRGEDFTGCDFGRVIVFDNNKILHCTGYSYEYGYRPTAIVLSNGTSFKMIVTNIVYDMAR